MPDRRAYKRRFTALSAWTVKAFLLVAAGAATVMVAMTITKHVSVEPDAAGRDKIIGVRHDAVAVPASGDLEPGGPGSNPTAASPYGASAQEFGTVVRNGITVVSPQLLVPVINLDALQTANRSDDGAPSSKGSSVRKPSRYAKRSHAVRKSRLTAKRWKAYGLANR